MLSASTISYRQQMGMDYSTFLIWVSSMCLFIQVLQFASSRKKPCTLKLPPGPAQLPLVGNLLKLGENPHESLAELAKIYGPLMTLRLGSVTAAVISSAAMAKEVLQKHDRAFAERKVGDAVRNFDFSSSSIAWAPPNQYWRKLRTVCKAHLFATERLNASQGLRRLKVQELIAHMVEKSAKREAVAVGQAAFVTTLNLISNTIFSMDVVDSSSRAQEFSHAVEGFMEAAGKPNVVDYFPLLRPLDPQGVRRRMAGCMKKAFGVIDLMIERRLMLRRTSPASPPHNDFLDALLDPGSEFTRHQMRCLIWDLFAAGSDTSSILVEWALTELLRNPDAMAKAQAELKEVIGVRKDVEESDIAQLPYLQAVINETLRLHPPAPLLLPRRARSNVEIAGFSVQEDSLVLVNAWAIARDPDAWDNPTSFAPERFLCTKQNFKGHDFGFIPFGAGLRACPGLPLGSRMVQFMLASLLHSFAWKIPDGMAPEDIDMCSRFGTTLRKAVPLLAIPVQYQ